MKYDINCALIILYDKDEVLLQKRTEDAPVLAGYWAFFGGGIEKEESPLQAVIREAKEELGYDLLNPEFLLEQNFTLEGKNGYMYVYIEQLKGLRANISCFEGEKLGWFKLNEIDSLKMLKHDREIVYNVFKAMSK